MSEPSSSFGLAVAFKLYGFKAVIGMIGAAMLYFVAPPLNKDGTFNRPEFVARLACAAVFSELLGDWAVALLTEFAPRIHALDHRAAIYLLVGAPAWWVSRGIALWFQKRRDKDIEQMARAMKKALK